MLAATGATLAAIHSSPGQVANTVAQPPPLSPTEQTLKDIKNPLPWLNWGGDLRLRNEYFNNAQTLNYNSPINEQDYFRFRARLWTSITPVDGLSLNARVAAEPREWMKPSSSGTYLNQSGMEWRYGIVDNLNVQWKKPLDLPATLTVGRQDIILGDGWLVADGTPSDGSWTYFLDSAKLSWDFKEQKTTVDMIGIVQYARPDAWLPTIGTSTHAGSPNAYSLTDQNEKGAILNIANSSIEEANMGAYFIYKHDTPVSNDPKYRNGDAADIFTFGGRLGGLIEEHWKYGLEGAYQFGEKKDPRLTKSAEGPAGATHYHDLEAFGFVSKLSYLVKDKWNTQFSVGYEYLSGDDPNTDSDEMFDVLWGRWPRFSELYNVYSYVNETRVAQTANLHRFAIGSTATPLKNLDVMASYSFLLADQEVPTRNNNSSLFTSAGTFRGQYLQAVLKYKFSQHLAGHLWGEMVFPGDFYTYKHPMTFLRVEINMTL
jgi:hypothetical protein